MLLVNKNIGPAYYRMCSIDTLFQNKFRSRHQRKLSPIISSFLELGRRKSLMQPKFVAAQRQQNRNPANIRKWIARFYYFRHLYSAKRRVYCSQYLLPIDMGNYLHCSLIYFWVPSSCFLHSDQPLSGGWNNPVQRCLPVGEVALSTPEAVGGFTHRLTDCFDVQPTTTSGNIITQSIIFSFSIS